MGKVININSHLDKPYSPLEALDEAARMIRDGDFTPTKMVILMLDDHEPGQYDRTWLGANAKYSEIVALMEVIKAEFVETLNGKKSLEEE